MRKAIIILAALMVLPAVGAAATIVTRPVTEQVVEGHTVFTVIQVRDDVVTQREEFAAAVAVLVRDVEQRIVANRFPGVLWFNDQYLVTPTASSAQNAAVRYPCTGAVFAVNAGGADPRGKTLTYVESYRITDPNDRTWDIHKWSDPSVTPAQFVWSVPVRNNEAGYTTADDGTTNCAPYEDNDANHRCGGIVIMPYANDENTPTYYDNGPAEGRNSRNCQSGLAPYVSDPGDHGLGYPCGTGLATASTNCASLQYNAVLFFFLQDLTAPGAAKNHTQGSADYNSDVSGCQDTYGNYVAGYGTPRQWTCPVGGDDDEGNSHPYNPERQWPFMVYDGRGNHGGSDNCDANPSPPGYTGDYNCHATRNIDIYYHYGVTPLPVTGSRTHRVFDVEGSTAPYHCHDAMAVCNEDEVGNSI